ncbi:hypothetical protein A2U01_0054004, partial [Trifolium medium]|nr:hypothetical protein [Trifolium medium]
MNMFTGKLLRKCSDNNFKPEHSYEIARTRGRDGRIRRTRYGHEEFLHRQAEQQNEEPVPVVHEEEPQAVQVDEEPVVQQSWPEGPI